jgi:hypothetical protein
VNVALVERTTFDTYRAGESLAPGIQSDLRRLDVWEDFLALGPLPSWETCSLWGDAELRSHNHFLSPYGNGWHVDRRSFDAMVASAARRAGAHMLTGRIDARSVEWFGHTWSMNLVGERGSSARLKGRVLVDATGRRAQISRALGAVRRLVDGLVGVGLIFEDLDDLRSGRLMVESMPLGWWYSAPIPGAAELLSRRVVLFMTDADICSELELARWEVWRDQIALSNGTRHGLGRVEAERPFVKYAHSHWLTRRPEDDRPWLAIGDAALAVDPISGSGVPRALKMAERAELTVRQFLGSASDALPAFHDYHADLDAQRSTYLRERAQYYAAERRFNGAFWERRHAVWLDESVSAA